MSTQVCSMTDDECQHADIHRQHMLTEVIPVKPEPLRVMYKQDL